MNNGRYVLDASGQAVVEPDLLKWAEWFETAKRQLANDVLPDGVRISTVFLGLDHGWGGAPELWETMIFGGAHDQYQARYGTREEALAGHGRAVELAKS